MSTLSAFTLVIFAFTPLVLTTGLLAFIVWMPTRNNGSTTDGPGWLLAAAARPMPEERRHWGAAMLAELYQIQGLTERWWFALGCIRVALFPPATKEWLPRMFGAFRSKGPVCGVLAVALPPLGFPLHCSSWIACDAFVEHDDFSGGGMETIIALWIIGSLACIVSGLPLGIAGLVRREQNRWLSVMGVLSSVSIIAYSQVVQHWASNLR